MAWFLSLVLASASAHDATFSNERRRVSVGIPLADSTRDRASRFMIPGMLKLSRNPLRETLTRAAAATAVMQFIVQALTVTLSIATARMLTPHEVGTLGVVVVVVMLISMAGTAVETACVTIRSDDDDRDAAQVAFALRGALILIAIALILATASRLISVLAGPETGTGEMIALLYLLLAQPAIETAGTYPRVLLQRRLELTRVAATVVIQVATHVGVSFVLLMLGWRALAIATGALVAVTVSTLSAWVMAHVDVPTRLARRATWYEGVRASSRVSSSAFLGFVNGRVDNILIAAILGPTAMSFYGMAWNASRIPFAFLFQALDGVLVPAVARVRDDRDRVTRLAAEALRHSYVVAAPLAAIGFVSATSLVGVVLGGNWLAAAPCLRVMSLTILLVPIVATCRAALIGMNLAHLVAIATAGHFVSIVITVPLLAGAYGILGGAFADLLSMSFVTIVLCILIRRALPGLVTHAVRAAWLPIVTVSAVGLGTMLITRISPISVPRLAAEAALVTVGYVVTLNFSGGHERVAATLNIVKCAVTRSVRATAIGAGAVDRRMS